MGRTLRAALITAAAALSGVFALGTAAFAHVEVSPDQASQGGVTRIAFQVPDESDTASTTKVQVFLPADTPIASVMVEPVPGWSATTTTSKLATPITTDDGAQVTQAVSQVTWTADSAGTAIKPGQFLEFPLVLGPLPKTAQVAFKTLQTYSDGSVVRWIDLSTPGQAEPEHPAPVLKLAAGTGDSAAVSGDNSAAPAAGGGGTGGGGSSTAALIVGIVGAALGLAGAILGGLALRRARN
jgi:uncharacterized protein YcnI